MNSQIIYGGEYKKQNNTFTVAESIESKPSWTVINYDNHTSKKSKILILLTQDRSQKDIVAKIGLSPEYRNATTITRCTCTLYVYV